MSSWTKRALTIDDPVAGAAACHVARPAAEAAGGRLREIPLGEIHPNPEQPRKRFDEASLGALADSIRERGVLQPIIVRPRSTGGYQLIAGERRWRASQIARRQTIPALVDGAVDDAVSLELALIENVAREDLISDGALSKGHGKALLTEADHCRRRELAERAAEGGWSVRALEAKIARASRPPRRSATDPHPDQVAAAAKLRELLARATGCEIEARPYRLGYELILDQDAVDRLAELLQARADR